IEALEVADQEHAEVDARGDGLPADALDIIGLTEGLDMGIEAGLGEQGVELVVEGVAWGAGEFGGRHPTVGLLMALATAHAHGEAPQAACLLGCPNIPDLSSGFSTGCYIPPGRSSRGRKRKMR